MYGFGVVGGDVFVDEFDVVFGEELFDVVELVSGDFFVVVLHHELNQSNIVKFKTHILQHARKNV